MQQSRGRPVRVGNVLFEALSVACSVAEWTGGAVDPTVGSAIERLGYDRDFAQMVAVGGTIDGAARPAPGWWRIELDSRRRTVRVPEGIHIDLGATAKALAADRAADRIASATGVGTLVSIGGDVSVAGPAREGGWPVGIATASSTPVETVTCVVAITEGGVASSSTVVRSWQRDGRRLHHIVDPATSCVDANAMSTAAIVWGFEAVDRLTSTGFACRLVDDHGQVTTIGGWPENGRWPPTAAAGDAGAPFR